MAKVFDAVWIGGILYKLTIFNFPSYFVKTISSYLDSPTMDTSYPIATSTTRRMRAGIAQGGIISPVVFSFYVKDMPSPCRHVQPDLRADDTAIISTSRQPVLLIKYLEAYLSDLERWLREWRIAINVSKSSAISSTRPVGPSQNPNSTTLRGANSMGR
jgi:hypothetical protein